jgi:hypothetical protein
MGVTGFLYVPLGSSTVQVAVANAYVQRLGSAVKMVIVVEKCATEEQSWVLFLGQKDSM